MTDTTIRSKADARRVGEMLGLRAATPPAPDLCSECGKPPSTHYSGRSEEDGRRLGISKHNPIPVRINVIADTPLPAEPRTKARSWDDPILYEAAVMRPQCTFITHWHSCRLDAGHPGRHSPGQLPAAPDPRLDLREALDPHIRTELVEVAAAMMRGERTCEKGHRAGKSEHIHFDDVHSWGQRIARVAAALATTPPAQPLPTVEDIERVIDGHLHEYEERCGYWDNADCTCGYDAAVERVQSWNDGRALSRLSEARDE